MERKYPQCDKKLACNRAWLRRWQSLYRLQRHTTTQYDCQKLITLNNGLSLQHLTAWPWYDQRTDDRRTDISNQRVSRLNPLMGFFTETLKPHSNEPLYPFIREYEVIRSEDHVTRLRLVRVLLFCRDTCGSVRLWLRHCNNTVIGTLAVDRWAVTFGTARRRLGGLRPAQPPPGRTKCNSPPIPSLPSAKHIVVQS